MDPINAQMRQIVQISAQGGEKPKNIVSPGVDAKKRCQAKTVTSDPVCTVKFTDKRSSGQISTSIDSQPHAFLAAKYAIYVAGSQNND